MENSTEGEKLYLILQEVANTIDAKWSNIENKTEYKTTEPLITLLIEIANAIDKKFQK